MEMPFHLRTLPPEALSILRYYAEANVTVAYADEIINGAHLSDRGFGKAIRRLVTRGYLMMDGDQRYRLTDNGGRSVEELEAYLESAPDEDFGKSRSQDRTVRRRLIMALPRTLIAGQPINAMVGFNDAEDEDVTLNPINLHIRLSVINGEPKTPREMPFLLHNYATRQMFEVTADNFTRCRVRVQVYQVDPDSDDEASFAGGMYVDLDVHATAATADTTLAAYGTDVAFSG